MKIVLLDYSTLGNIRGLEKLNDLGEFEYYEYTSPEERVSRIEGAEIVITNKVVIDQNVIDSNPKLKLICILATGVDNVDVAYAKTKGVQVKNVSGYSTQSVAQHTFACLLSLIHQIQFYDHYVKSGEYAKSKIFTHIGYEYWELKGKVFGIIGLGAIGKKVAQIAQAFGAEVCYYSTSGKNYNPDYRQVNKDELFETSDVISIHAPLNEHTKHLVGETELRKMKKSAMLINMGRGGIVDEKALAEVLDEELIFGAVLDVLEKEPIEHDHPLLGIQNKNHLLITPHIAWASTAARASLVKQTIENVEHYLQN